MTQVLKIANSDKKVSEAVAFEMDVVVTADITNAEGNMTHYEYVRLFTQAVERYVGREIAIQATPVNMSFKYIQDILPGQKIIVKLWTHEQSNKDSIVFMAEFVNADTAKIHALGVQEIYAEKRNHSFVGKRRESPLVNKQFKILKEWIACATESKSSAKYVLTVTKTICFGRTTYFGTVSSFEYANIFGEVREVFGLTCIPQFKKDVGKKFILSTNEANYSIIKHFKFGDKIKTKMWVESSGGASFILRAEFWNGRHFCGTATQRIGYCDLRTGQLRLPIGLKKQLKMVAGYSKFSFITRPIIALLMPLKFLWK